MIRPASDAREMSIFQMKSFPSDEPRLSASREITVARPKSTELFIKT
jgi:hypothetical protein